VNDVEIINPYGFIYITTNTINGKKYIGQRMFNTGWRGYLGSGMYFLRAVKKYGRENFKKEIIAIAYFKEDLDKLEIEYIKNHNAVVSKEYYNISFGGSCRAGFAGLHHSEESKRKMSKSRKGKKLNVRLRPPKIKIKTYINKELGKKKLSMLHKGVPLSEQTRERMRKPKVKLNKEQVVEIREKFNTGEYLRKQLAVQYLVGIKVIYRIINCQGAYKVA